MESLQCSQLCCSLVVTHTRHRKHGNVCSRWSGAHKIFLLKSITEQCTRW